MNLSDLSLKRPVFVTVIILALVTLGVFSYSSLSINDMPDIDIPYVAVAVVWPGVAPEQLETEVGQKIEGAVGQISGVKHITNISQESLNITLIEFNLEAPPGEATQNVRDKVSAIRYELPDGIEEPVVIKADTNAMPVVSLVVSGSLPVREMSALVDDVIQPRLERVNGVGQISTYGFEEREIQIKLNKDKLAAYGITTNEVVSSLSAQNLDVPGGSLSSDGQKVTTRTTGKVKTVDQINSLPVARRDGVQLYVSDIAEVEDGVKEQDSLARYNGAPAIGIDLVKQTGTNTVELADDIKKTVEEIKLEMPPGVTIDLVRDNSIIIRDSVSNVVHTIIEGCLLAVLIVFLFLKDWRITLISAVALPTSIISTFFVFKLLGYTLNTMTLGALSLAVGLLVDDSIVVIENIVRHIRMGKTPLQAAREGTAEIGLAVLATTLAVVSVFLPMAMMSGIAGKMFIPFSMTVVFAVLVSLLVSFTLVPILAARNLTKGELAPRGRLGKCVNWFNDMFERLAAIYERLLTLALKKRLLTMAVVLVMLVASLAVVPLMGTSFIPDQDTGDINIVVDLDSGLNLDRATALNDELISIIKGHAEVVATYSTIEAEQLNIYAKLTDREERSNSNRELGDILREEFKSVPGVQVAFNYVSTMGGSLKDATFSLLGEDNTQLQDYSEKAQQIMQSIPGAVDIKSTYKPGKPEVQLQIKPEAAADLGVSPAAAGSTLNTLLGGSVVGQFKEGENSYDIRVRLGESQRQNIEDLNNIYIANQYGTLVPLSQVSEKNFSTTPSELRRYDKAKMIELSANLKGVSPGDFNSTFTKLVDQEMNLPAGYKIQPSGLTEMMGDSFSSIGMALFLGILFMFFVLAAQFESYIDPLAVILSLPLAIIGAILGMLIGGKDVSMAAMIGIVMLMGLVSKNAILLIDFAKAERERGAERGEALIKAVKTRFRPIMMTSLAMILSMVPLALGIGAGAEMRSPMAQAIIGGLITSTLLTMVVVPVVYTLLDDVRDKLFRMRKSPTNETSSESKESVTF